MQHRRSHATLILMPSSQPFRICVFCGSANGAGPAYVQAAKELGRNIAVAGMGLVYGGATVGLMGVLADAALEGGAEVIGVMPDVLMDREIAHQGLTRLHIVKTMHERKALMSDHADAFIALPGGYGTLDEFIEIVTWAQLRIHQKPCILLNINGYFDGFLAFLDHGVQQGHTQRSTFRAESCGKPWILGCKESRQETGESMRGRLRPFRPPACLQVYVWV
jgi:uncharacterized protein (TIGR00730 family)